MGFVEGTRAMSPLEFDNYRCQEAQNCAVEMHLSRETYLNTYLNTVRAGGDFMAVIKIENVVASTSLGGELDLQAIALALDGAEYEPEQFPGLIYRLKEPKTATLLFRSGKVVCTGAKSLEQVKTAISKVAKQIEAAGIVIKIEPKIEVQNIVASSDLGAQINLNAIAISLGLEKVEYEPEQFPGLVYRIDSPKVVVLLFGSGKLVCTGARKPEDVEAAVDKITEELKAAGLLR
jgi:transcription initiation factor TFIID TATA-box-binding protein